MNKQKPKILQSPLTGEFYFVPKYEVIDEHHFRAITKIDITEQLIEIGLIEKKEENKEEGKI